MTQTFENISFKVIQKPFKEFIIDIITSPI